MPESTRESAGSGSACRTAKAPEPSRAWTYRTVVWYLRVVAVLDLLGAVLSPLRRQLTAHNTGDFFTPYLVTAGFTAAGLAAFLSVMMRRRKRAAWIFNLVMTSLYLALVVVSLTALPGTRHHWFDWLSAAITAGFFAVLLIGRRQFRARGDRSNPWLALGTLIVGGAAGAVVGTTLVSLTTAGSGSLAHRFQYALMRIYTLAPSSSGYADVLPPRWVDVVINLLSLGVLLLVLYVLFRAPRGKRSLSSADEDRLRELLDRYGAADSLGYFALRRDKSALFSPSGKAAVTYRVEGGVCLASGDPIGDVEAWPGAIEAWLAQAREHAWIPAVMGASETAGTVYARHGLDALELGDEAIVYADEFTLEGRAMRTVRQAHKRIARGGHTVRVRRHRDIPADELAALVRLADRWRDGETERGFSMALGRLGDPADGDCVMAECLDADGVPKALLSFVPWGTDGLSLDLMRRDRESDNGLIEYLVIELVRNGVEALGVRRVSLNFAMFRAVFERGSRLGAGPVLRAWRAVLLFLSRWWQIESLYRANAKYRPEWVPRYLLFARSADLPHIGFASMRAEGFVRVPRLRLPARSG
ncbi:phosphatidylglycerol lysyltransferase domain-containing protein [Phaeacidiphilus oryzae]|uniref:phosphatidylglycerol lysyltransferase domain-containing protein n=1 Tax=Phaeacidiphilus oryzae TaxID=348818 RepID=UPI00068C6B94|nr:phosphatidylglycerol lysyltransferase domain-containing protein [Phaeacidiphilus oryzae]